MSDEFPYYSFWMRHEKCFNVIQRLEGILRSLCIDHLNIEERKLKKQPHKYYSWYMSYIKRRSFIGNWIELFFPDFPKMLKIIEQQEIYHKLRAYTEEGTSLEELESIVRNFCDNYKDKIEKIIQFLFDTIPKLRKMNPSSRIIYSIYYYYKIKNPSYVNYLEPKDCFRSLVIEFSDESKKAMILREIKEHIVRAKEVLKIRVWVDINDKNTNKIVVSL